MAVKIRLQRRGRRKKPFYHIVIADERAPRDGRFIEKIGTYNPMTKPATVVLDRDRAFEWLMKGAQPTDTARAILKFQGVMYRKHLQRGVSKDAMTQEQADEKYTAWVDDKNVRIAALHAATAEERVAWHKQLSGKVKPVVIKEVEVAEEVLIEVVAPAEKAAAPVAEEVVTEEAAVVEEAPAAPVEEAPAVEETPVAEATEETPAEPVAEEAVAEEATEEAPAEEAKEETTEETTTEGEEKE